MHCECGESDNSGVLWVGHGAVLGWVSSLSPEVQWEDRAVIITVIKAGQDHQYKKPINNEHESQSSAVRLLVSTAWNL